MDFISIVLSVLLVLSSCSTVQSAIIYVSTPQDENSIDNCTTTTRDKPCHNLDASLKLVEHQSNSALLLFPGNYTLPSNTKYTFNKVTGLTISKVDHINSTVPVVIKCTRSTKSNTGLGFIGVKDIHIVGVSFDGCGVIRNSTSRNFDSNPVLSLVSVMATLYFDNCENVVLSSVDVSRSVGVAVQMYSTNGSVEIINSTFIDSTPNNDGSWGGGVYIEFPYCKPGDDSCDSPQSRLPVDILSVSNSNYEILNCIFRNNHANDSDTSHLVLPYHSYHKSMARGGGLSIFFKGSSTNNNINISNCVFDNNSALYGGGMYVEMQDSAHENSVYLSDSHFKNNYAKLQGGGLLASYLCMVPKSMYHKVTNGTISLRHVTFDNNRVGEGGKGGGVSYVGTRHPNDLSPNKFSISDSVFNNNTAFLGSAIRVSIYSIVATGYLAPILIENVLIQNNVVQFSSNTARPLGSGTLFISHIPLILRGSISFNSNHGGTALAAYNCKIEVTNDTFVSFENNTGYNGGALSLRSSSVLELGELVELYFVGNKAFDKGGAIYADLIDPSIDVETQGCFIQYYDIYTNPRHWNVTVTFLNNTNRDDIPNSIHASSLHPCILGQPYGVTKNEQELLLDVFCWNSNDSIIWDYGDDDCNTYITSDLKTFDKSVTSTPLDVIPGRPVFMNLRGFDDQGDNVNTSIIVYAYSLDKDDGVEVDSAYTYISNNEIKLKNKNNASSASIQLDTVGQQLEVQTTLSIQFKKCPPGLSLNPSTGLCFCNGTFGGVLKCDSSNLEASLLYGYWIGEQSECTKSSQNQAVVSHCKFCNFSGLSSVDSGYYELGDDWDTLEKQLCGENQHGFMCGLCKDGYKPAININEFNCVECKSVTVGVILFVVFNILCPLLFIVFLFFMDVPLTNGLLHGPIFFAQMVTTVVTLDAEDIIKYKEIVHSFHHLFEQVYTTVYGIFNLDFFINFLNKCIGFDHFSQIVCLQCIAALVPMVVVLLSWLFITCCNRRARGYTNMKEWFQKRFESIANLMATCILLSYTKLLVIVCNLLTPISLVSSDGKIGDYSHSALYIDGSICYSYGKLYLYVIISLIVTVCFLIPVPVFMLFFRFKSDESRGGFFDKLLKQFQQQFRNGKDDFPSLATTEGDTAPTHLYNREQNDCVCCDPLCTCCGKTIFNNRTEYSCECCTPNYFCKCYQKQSRYFCCSINTSFSLYDLRWLSGFMFILRIIMVMPYILAWTNIIRYCLQLSICVFAGVLMLVIKPYKRNLYKYVDCNRVEAFFFFSLAFLLSLCIYQYNYSTTSELRLSTWVYAIQVMVVTIPFVWIIVVYTVHFKEKYKGCWLSEKVKPYLVMCCSTPDRVPHRRRHSNFRRNNSNEAELISQAEDCDDDDDDDDDIQNVGGSRLPCHTVERIGINNPLHEITS